MADTKKFYVTTPIYYGNGLPHVGHFYSSTIADIIYRYHKIAGYKARFTTGIDENSQKAVIKAQEEGMEIMEYLDQMAGEHRKVWDYFNMGYTDFIRTTESRHHELVREVLQHCFDKEDIYPGIYEGMYCVGCEGFKKDDDLVFFNKTSGETFPITPKVIPSENIIKVCPDHLKTPDTIKEKNYFFKLSQYQTWIEEFYAANPDFVLPDFRYNEVKAFVDRGLEDFSISRETNTFGISLPFDDSQVTYVWFDALFNYYTSLKYSPIKPHLNSSPQGEDETAAFLSSQEREFKSEVLCGEEYWGQFRDESDMWPANLHVVGKDIIRFHAIFWPAMLASYFDLGEQGTDGVLHYIPSDRQKLPETILAGGFFTVDGQKMSKSLGNVIEPVSYTQEYGKELLTLYMLSAFPIGNDGNYDREEAIKTYNAKLANNLGNLVNRVVVLSLKLGGILESPGKDITSRLFIACEHDIGEMYENYNLKGVLDTCFEKLDILNKYADETQPWQLIKTDVAETKIVLYTLAEGLRQVGLDLYPFFPEKMREMFLKLGIVGYRDALDLGRLQELREKTERFEVTEKGEPLFKRIDI